MMEEEIDGSKEQNSIEYDEKDDYMAAISSEYEDEEE